MSHPAHHLPRAVLARLGREVAWMREACGWTQSELARKAGVTPGCICKLEQGRFTPALGTLYRIAKVMRCSVGDFL